MSLPDPTSGANSTSNVSNADNASTQVQEVRSQDTLNPPIIITQHPVPNGCTVSVVRDDYLTGGTKQRALAKYMRARPDTSHFLYAGPAFGFAQVALAHCARVEGRNAVVVVAEQRDGCLFPLTAAAKRMGGTILEKAPPNRMQDVRLLGQDYCKRQQQRNVAIECLPFGLESEEYMSLLASAVTQALPTDMPPPRRVWLAVGSGVILRSLHRVWPDATFLCVRVGKEIYPDIVEGINHEIYTAPERFWEPAQQPPPYPSVTNYDAKLWQFIQQHGQEGDLVWNVGRDVHVPSSNNNSSSSSSGGGYGKGKGKGKGKGRRRSGRGRGRGRSWQGRAHRPDQQ